MPERSPRLLRYRPICLLGAGVGFLAALSSSSLAGWTPRALTSGDSTMFPRLARPAPASIRATPPAPLAPALLALLRPNGVGTTTTINRCLGFVPADGDRAPVAGLAVLRRRSRPQADRARRITP